MHNMHVPYQVDISRKDSSFVAQVTMELLVPGIMEKIFMLGKILQLSEGTNAAIISTSEVPGAAIKIAS